MRAEPVIYIILIAAMFLIPEALAQTQESDPPGDRTENETSPDPSEPVIDIEEQPYKYYYWPDEDLNNFGLSSMGSGQGGTTLGRDSERKSNLEINPRGKPEKKDEQEVSEEEVGSSETTLSAPTTEETETGSDYTSNPASHSPIFKWVDDEGNIHITNNIGDVPLKYQEDYYKSSGSEEDN